MKIYIVKAVIDLKMFGIILYGLGDFPNILLDFGIIVVIHELRKLFMCRFGNINSLINY